MLLLWQLIGGRAQCRGIIKAVFSYNIGMEKIKRKSFIFAVMGLAIAIIISLGFLIGAIAAASSDEVNTTQVIRASWGDITNEDLGQRIFTNESELEQFMARHRDSLGEDIPEFGLISFATATAKYDSNFFVNHYLAIYIVEAGSSSHKPSFIRARQENGFYNIHFNRNITPIGNRDYMRWIIIARIPRVIEPSSVRFVIHRN